MSQAIEKDYWEERYNQLFPDGLTFEETEQANAVMWKAVQSTEETDSRPEPIRVVRQGQ